MSSVPQGEPPDRSRPSWTSRRRLEHALSGIGFAKLRELLDTFRCASAYERCECFLLWKQSANNNATARVILIRMTASRRRFEIPSNVLISLP
jgi:hypothetical protein